MFPFLGCHQPPQNIPLVVVVCGMECGVHDRGPLPTPEEKGAADEDAEKLLDTAFATEYDCHGLRLWESGPVNSHTPTEAKTFPHSLVVVHDATLLGRWSYTLNYNHIFGATVDSEHDIAKQVCRILGGKGGLVTAAASRLVAAGKP
jgi:hypothetical protein